MAVQPRMSAVAVEAARASRVRVSHILVETEGMAQTVFATLDGGASFESVAESVSTCDSKARGGDLGWITPGLMVPEFDAAAFLFPPGKLATVETSFGWHVLRVAEASYVSPEIEPLELKRRVAHGDANDAAEPRLILVDLRDDEERKKAMLDAPFLHLPYKEWMTWAEEAIAGTLAPPLPRESEIVFMDHRGGRGERIMQYLSQNGFVNTRFLRGGINAYAEEADASVPTYLESDGDCVTCHEH